MSSRLRLLPFLDWAPELRRKGVLRADLMAGLTGAVVVLPQGVAFAAIAGMPAQYGLYTAMVPAIVAALFGSSRLMVSGPANAIALSVSALIGPLAQAGTHDYVVLALTLSLMTGLWQLLVGVAGLGRFVRRVPHAVIVGFTSGAAVLIANSEVRHFFGFDWSRGMHVIDTLTRLPQDISTFDPPALVVGSAALLACIAARRIGTGWLPYMLVGVVTGGAVAQGLVAVLGPDWALRAIEPLPSAVPPLSLPDLSLETLRMLLVPSLVMTLIALAEAMAIASAVALARGQSLNGTQETLAQGASNILGGLFSSFPSSGSFNRSAVNVEAGARTPVAAIAASLLLIPSVAFVGPLVSYLPLAALAGVLFMVAWTLFDFGFLKRAFGQRRWADATGWGVTFVLTLATPLEVAIVIGIACHVVVARVLRPAGES